MKTLLSVLVALLLVGCVPSVHVVREVTIERDAKGKILRRVEVERVDEHWRAGKVQLEQITIIPGPPVTPIVPASRLAPLP